MRSRELLTRAALLVAALLLAAAGCVSNPDPHPRSIASLQSDAHGSFAVVYIPGREVDRYREGELIAVNAEAVWLLDGHALVLTPLATVRWIEVYPFDASQAGVVTWGLLGTTSTISHGVFLIFSVPTWLLTTAITAAIRASEFRYSYVPGQWQGLAKWARFPQGLPPGLTADELVNGRALAPAPAAPAPQAPPAAASPAPAPSALATPATPAAPAGLAAPAAGPQGPP